jgi:diguanylate cyclase (GGDEF)-like protein
MTIGMSDRQAERVPDHAAVRATLLWGVRLTLIAVAAGVVYASFAPAVGHRGLVLGMFASAVPAALAVRAISPVWLAGSRYRNVFFGGWTALCIAQVTTVVALDRADGPLVTLYLMPLLFIVMSYPAWLVAGLSVASVAAYASVALTQSGVSPWEALFFGVAIACTGMFALVAAREHIRQNGMITSLSLRDPLTGLPNRTVLSDRLERAVRGHGAAGEALAVLFFDLDDFKVVNDSLGHPAGDSLLRQVVDRVREGLRGENFIARFGGDEFVVVCERLRHPAEAVMIAERLSAIIRAEPFVLEGNEHHVTASVGVATNGGSLVGADTLIRDADAAMYRAKAAGRGRVEIFDDLLRRRLVDRVALERDLRRALDGDELYVVYQPIVALGDPRPRAEALVRWRHPERGVISPADFIAVAEESGLIHELGERVLHIACAQTAAWRRAPGPMADMRISVNVSARQLADGGFPSRVAGALAASGLDASELVLEITESAVLADVNDAEAKLAALKAIGVSLSLDDFGTGHSSVTSLLRLPLLAIKIDRTFVAGVVESPRHAAVVKGMVAMARDLGLRTIVEGVETAEQLELLKAIGCVTFQGYHFSRPVEAEQLAAWVAGRGPLVDARSA